MRLATQIENNFEAVRERADGSHDVDYGRAARSFEAPQRRVRAVRSCDTGQRR